MPRKRRAAREPSPEETERLREEALRDLERFGTADDPRNDPVLNRFMQCPSLQRASALLGEALYETGGYRAAEARDPLPIPIGAVCPW